MKKALSITLNIVIAAVMAFMLIVIAGGIWQKTVNKGKYVGFFKTGYALVVSGSMEPNLHVGEIVVYRDIPQEEYQIGDIIVYVRDRGEEYEMLITHRIILIQGDRLITKGDHNSVNDKEIGFEDVVGKVVFHMTAVGKAAAFLKSPLGMVLLLGFAGVLLVLSFFIDRKKKDEEPDEKPIDKEKEI